MSEIKGTTLTMQKLCTFLNISFASFVGAKIAPHSDL